MRSKRTYCIKKSNCIFFSRNDTIDIFVHLDFAYYVNVSSVKGEKKVHVLNT